MRLIMGLRLRLQWYDKETELGEGNEFSSDFGDDAKIMTKDLGLPTKGNVNNGFFDVEPEWIPILQPHFLHKITPTIYDYQVSFDYRDKW